MQPFLKQVAAHYFQGGDIQRKCFLFPNRRSMVFFRKYLADLVRESPSARPLPVPPMFTINDFFYRLNHTEVSDKLRLLLELYQVYKELNPQAEALDEFIFWGDVLLSDFDDVDKYLVDARALMQNVSDFKAMQDGMDYLSEEQKNAIRHFLNHFRDGKTLPDGSGVKARFLKLWNILYPLYRDFKARLLEKGMAYEGMVYRSLAARLQEGSSVVDILKAEFPETESFAVVGLNALNECERMLLRRMRDAGVAQFVWDFVSADIRDAANKSSLFMRRNLADFPQAFPIDPEGLGEPEITVISVPSSVGQAKLAPQILAHVQGDPVETAFVLPDESLLLPLLNSLPEEQDSVNVTMGYPMSGSAVYTLIVALGQLQLRMRKRNDGWYFYHRPVKEVFSSGLLKILLTPEESAVLRRVKADAKYYIPVKDLQGGPLLDLLFRPVIVEPGTASPAQNHETERYLSEIVAFLGRHLSSRGEMLLELDFAKRCHTQLSILEDTDLELLPATHLRMIQRLLEGISVPFRGEPLQGLQIMGPLETRALDFRNLIILSANEGVFPRRSFSTSFIPPELRRGFGLPTYEYQDAVWAYYFYRMIQRPQKVWILYDSRSEGLKSGEESRYIKQLQYHFHKPLRRMVASAPLLPVPAPPDILKTEEHIRIIRETVLSATTLNSYISCPAKFYYQVVEGRKAEEEVAEFLDAGMLGNVFHHVMYQLYRGKEIIGVRDLQALQKDTARLKRMIRAEVMDQMHSLEVSGRNLVLEEVILDYVLRTLRHDESLLQESGSAGFRIIGLEKKRLMEYEGFRIKGFLDRIDSYRDGELRIVDYKTGNVEKSDEAIALQLFLYDQLIHADPSLKDYRLVNSIYSTACLYSAPLPDMPESEESSLLMHERLRGVLNEMTALSVPFHRTEDRKRCEWCDFKDLCGR